MDDLLQQAATILSRSRRLVVLTGAGMSKESGIPTFRDARDGLWAQYDPMQLATMRGFQSNPELVWRWYQYRFGLLTSCTPNPGHHAIAELERRLPHVVVITQNVDGLHAAAGSSTVLEIHGSIRRYKCLAGHRNLAMDDLAGQDAIPPRCPRPGCTALVRPDVVWFGETLDVDLLHWAVAESETCDAMLIVGTSGVVQPAASLPYSAWNHRARLVEVNPEPSELTPLAHLYLQGRAGEILPQILSRMALP